MPLVSAIRTADANNYRALANLAIGAVWTGVGTYVGAGRAHVDITITAVQAGTLTIDECDDNATWVTMETWAVAAGTVAATFPYGFTRRWYRLTYTQGAIAGNVAVDGPNGAGPELDPRPVDASLPIQVTAYAAGARTLIAPLGGRYISIRGYLAANPLWQPGWWTGGFQSAVGGSAVSDGYTSMRPMQDRQRKPQLAQDGNICDRYVMAAVQNALDVYFAEWYAAI